MQVLWNLMGNAIKFTPEGGKVRLVVTQVAEVVRFSVKDNGPGLESAEIAKVFDRFWQSARAAELGTGLGLSIAKGIVEAHQGRLWVESVLGQGCEFIFEIPIFSVARKQTEALPRN